MNQRAMPGLDARSGEIALEPPRHDRHLVLSSGASLLLHGIAVALLVAVWHTASKPDRTRQPIPVTLVKAEDALPTAIAHDMPALSAPPAVATLPHTTALPKAAPRTAGATQPVPARVPAKPAPPRRAAPPARPSADLTALLAEGVDGRQHGAAAAPQSKPAIRSSAPLSDDYLIVLQGWLAQFQRYPEDAKIHRREGTGVVGFTLARDGRVVKVWMDQSTGSPSLDRATVSMIEAASPVPPPPKMFGGNTIDFFMPIDYRLSH